jgi:hypothetical protein
MNLRSSLILFLLGAASALCFAETARIPIVAWAGPPSTETTPERYRELAEAGFMINFSGFPNAEAMQKGLDIAHGAGIQQMVSFPELNSDPEGSVRKFIEHPGLYGYYLRDEPNTADFPALTQWAKRIQAVDSKHPCYINLFPNYANAGQLGAGNYAEYVNRFIAEVPMPFVSFDHYPVVGKSLRPEWYENLEIISRAAAKAKKPFWGFILAVAHNPYPVPTIEHLRLQAFSNLAYGAQVIQYFTYWTPRSTVWDFHMGPIDVDGRRTPVYDLVKTMNAEIQKLAPVFFGSHVVHVGHLGSIPRGANAFEPQKPIASIKADGEALVSILAGAKRRYLVLVNRELAKDVTVDVGFLTRVTEVTKEDAVLPENQGRRSISPGGILVFAWEE